MNIETFEVGDHTYTVRKHEALDRLGIMRDFVKCDGDVADLMMDPKFVLKVLSRTTPHRDGGKDPRDLGKQKGFNIHFRGSSIEEIADVLTEVLRVNGFLEHTATSSDPEE